MAGLRSGLVFILGFVCSAEQVDTSVTPIAKVITLLTDLKTKSQTNKASEETLFGEKVNEFTKGQTALEAAIADDENNIMKFTAAIESADALIKATQTKIKELDDVIAKENQDLKSSTLVRDQERADFTASNSDYGESVAGLTAAKTTIESQDVTTAQASFVQTMLLQLQSRTNSQPLMPAELQKTLSALDQVSSTSDSASVSLVASSATLASADSETPADGYDFQAGGVLTLVSDLKDKFTSEKSNLVAEETAAQSAYDALAAQLASNIAAAETELGQKKVLLAQTQQSKADSEDDLQGAEAARDADNESLRVLKSARVITTRDFHAADQLRDEEIIAIGKALTIISGDAVAGSGARNLPTFFQLKSQRRSAFANLRSEQESPTQGKMIAFLSQRARSLNSDLLSDIAQRAQGNPFVKVKKMVKDLMVKLMEEATNEMEHKGYCDTELTTNKMTRDKKSADISSLTLEIEDLSATISKLTQEVGDLTEVMATNDAKAVETNSLRTKTKAANAAALKDAKAAISAVEDALSVLRDFYAKAAESVALAQTSSKADPTSQSHGAGIVDMLEVILTDFTRLDSETTAAEATDSEQFKERMFEYKKNRALHSDQISRKEEKKTAKESALQSAKTDLDAAQNSLTKAETYYAKLKPDCVDSGITYAERKAGREAEIASLEQALGMLAA